jgi:acetyl-CoA carboxylase biotin carboxyl carrier protein
VREQIEALVERRDGGEVVVGSPKVGLYGFAPRVGEVLVGGSRVGRVTCLGRTADVVLPAGVTGRLVERVLDTRSDPVGYGDTLLRLMPVEAAEVGNGVLSPVAAASRDLPEGTLAVTSPTHGMFYRRANPDTPPYVEVGDVIDEGATLALVEVMKCFSAIHYGGPGLPPRAEVVEIRPSDGVEVRSDEVLFVVRPA